MSAHVVHEIDIDPQTLADDINARFGFIAARLPTELKLSSAGTELILSHCEGVGRLSARYLGAFTVKVRMVAEGYDGRLGFAKDYKFQWPAHASEGELIDMQPTVTEDFANCPAPLVALETTIQVLHEAFIKGRRMETVQAGQVTTMDDYRLA